MKKSSPVSFVIAGCVALALAGCNQKSTTDADAAKARQLQEMQDKLNALNSRSEDLARQISDRDAADEEARRQQLSKDQADVERQRAQLEADRSALAAETPRPVSDDNSEAEAEPVYQGKPSNYDLFYTKLQNDGDWIESDDYGYIWQPSVAARDNRWRPYTDGRWVETDRGWTWDSNERFGWATYHYGRWVNLSGSGWCWVPGDQWAPAWVSWRSSEKYVGWAPLPPEARLERGGSINASMDVGYDSGPGYYNFVDTEDFGEDTYLGHVVDPERNVTIIDQTVNVTNISYNQTVINNYGPDYDQIGRRSRRPVNRYRLDLDQRPDFADNSTRPRAQGDRLAVVAPTFAANAREERNIRPVKVEKKIIKTEREKGWRGIDPAQRAAVQTQLKKQADQQAQRQQAAQQDKLRQAAVARRQQARQAAAAQRAANANPPTPNAPSGPASPEVMPRAGATQPPAANDAQRQRQAQQRQNQEKAQQLARQKAQQANQEKARARAQQPPAVAPEPGAPDSPATPPDPSANPPGDRPDRPKPRSAGPVNPARDRDPQAAAAAQPAAAARRQQAAQAQRAQQAAQAANQEQRSQAQAAQQAQARQAARAQQAAQAQAQAQAQQAAQAAQAARREAAPEQAHTAQPERRQPENQPDQPSNPGRAQQAPRNSEQRRDSKPDASSDDAAKAEKAKKRNRPDQPEP